jgi:hypothetical protein
MTTQAFISLALKLIAAYYLIQTIAGVAVGLGSGFTYYGSQLGWSWVIVSYIVVPVVFVVGLLGVIKRSDFLATKLTRDESLLATPQVSLKDMQVTAFSCIGLSLAASSLPEITRLVTYYIILPKIKFGEILLGTKDWNLSAAVAVLVQLMAGLFLFLQARGLATLWGSLQRLKGLKDT